MANTFFLSYIIWKLKKQCIFIAGVINYYIYSVFLFDYWNVCRADEFMLRLIIIFHSKLERQWRIKITKIVGVFGLL